MSDFPWFKLKAATLRLVCADLGFTRLWNKDVMQGLLQLIQDEGLERALDHEKELQEEATEEKSAQLSTKSPSTSIRTRSAAVISDYGTRLKRKRLSSDPGPGLSRRKSGHSVATMNGKAQPRKRRRPLKTKTTPKKKATAPLSTSSHQIFDGVELPAPRFSLQKGKEKAEYGAGEEDYLGNEDDFGDDDAEGEIDTDHEYENHILVQSSLASSNKENESIHDDVPEEAQETEERPVEAENRLTPPTNDNPSLRERLLLSFGTRKEADEATIRTDGDTTFDQ